MVVPEVDLEVVILFESYLDGEEGFCTVVVSVDYFTSLPAVYTAGRERMLSVDASSWCHWFWFLSGRGRGGIQVVLL